MASPAIVDAETKRVEGMWRLPEQDKETPGTLTIAGDGSAELYVPTGLRTFSESGISTTDGSTTTIRFTEDSLAQAGQYPRIIGAAGTTDYTLENCLRTRSQTIFGGGTAETILVNQVYAGIQFEPAEAAKADGLRLRLAHLEDWVQETGIDETIAMRNDGAALTEVPSFTLQSTQLPKRSITLSDGSTLSLVHRLGLTGNRLDERALTQHFQFHIDRMGTVPIEDLLEYGGRLQDIVSIGTCRTAAFKDVRAVHPDLVRPVDDKTVRESFEVIAEWTVRDAASHRRRPMEHDMWFTLKSLGGLDAVGRWLDAAVAYRTPVRRVMATTYSPTMYQSDRLLNCAAALEAFDRKRTGTKGSKFRARIKRSVALAGPTFTELLPNVDVWVQRVCDERNDAAHQLDKLAKTESAVTYWMWRSLYLLFVLCMLHEANAASTATGGIKNHTEYRRLRKELHAAL